jgi:hypothetical protein
MPTSASLRTANAGVGGFAAFCFCFDRNTRQLSSDSARVLTLLLQPIVLGIALRWWTADISVIYFASYSVLAWLGLRNGQVNVEQNIRQLKREGVIIKGRTWYFVANALFVGLTTTVQSVVLFASVAIVNAGLPGKWLLGVLAVTLLGWITSSGWLFLSLFFHSQKLLGNFIPVFVVLQILSSGFLISTKDMAEWQLNLCKWTPAFATQRIIDLSLLSGRRISGDLIIKYTVAYFNINALYRGVTGERLKAGTIVRLNEWFANWFLLLTCWLSGFSVCSVAVNGVRQRREKRLKAERLTE